MAKTVYTAFGAAVRDINSEVWLISAGLSHLAAVARSSTPAVGTHLAASLKSILPTVPMKHIRPIRLRRKNLKPELEQASSAALRWCYGYFAVVVRSLAENAVYDRLRALSKTSSTLRGALLKRRTRKVNSKKWTKTLADVTDAVAKELCRGQDGWLKKVYPSFDLVAGHLDQQLKQANRLRNNIAHRLLDQREGRPVTAARWKKYVKTYEELMARLP